MANRNGHEPGAAVHPNTLRALKEHGWKPGQSGNIAGRPKKDDTITSILKEFLNLTCEEQRVEIEIIKQKFKVENPSWRHVVAASWLIRSIDKTQSPAILLDLLNRVDGKVKKEAEDPVDTEKSIGKIAKLILVPGGKKKKLKAKKEA